MEFYGNDGDIAFDIDKRYTHILCNCDSFGWSLYAPADEVKPFDGVIETCMCYVETTSYKPLWGNGWYFDDTTEEALHHKLIHGVDIKYQIKQFFILKPNHFEQFFTTFITRLNQHTINPVVNQQSMVLLDYLVKHSQTRIKNI